MAALVDPKWADLERGRVYYVRFTGDPRLRIKSLQQWARRNGTHAHTVRIDDHALVVIEP